MQVVVVDLGMGNLLSVRRALERVGAEPVVSSDPRQIESARAIVLPGQGAFSGAAKALSGGISDALLAAIESGKPYLGICLGMQLLFDESEESPGDTGLGVIAGTVKKIRPQSSELKVPHMGWNRVHSEHRFVPDREWFYFVHSFYCAPNEADVVAATVNYGDALCAAIARDNVFACQFHPEKSQDAGEGLFRNFLQAAY